MPLFLLLSLSFITEYNVIWYGIPPWSARVSCPGFVLYQPLAHPELTGF